MDNLTAPGTSTFSALSHPGEFERRPREKERLFALEKPPRSQSRTNKAGGMPGAVCAGKASAEPIQNILPQTGFTPPFSPFAAAPV